MFIHRTVQIATYVGLTGQPHAVLPVGTVFPLSGSCGVSEQDGPWEHEASLLFRRQFKDSLERLALKLVPVPGLGGGDPGQSPGLSLSDWRSHIHHTSSFLWLMHNDKSSSA